MKKLITSLILSSCILIASYSFGCSELNHDFGSKTGMYTARTMDIFIDLQPNLTVYPRGLKQDSGLKNNSLTWTNKYGYVSIDETNLNNLTGEGLNEKGLAVHLLYLGDTKQPKRDLTKPGVNGLFWVRYVLGNFTSVQEVLDDLGKYQIYTPPINITGEETYIPIHYMVEDKTGDSALVEYIDGKITVHRNVKAISNEPSYNQQLKNLEKAKKLNLYNIDQLPGGANSAYRFIRTSFINENLPEAETSEQAVNYLFAAMDSVSVPFTKGYKDESLNNPGLLDKWPTQWKSVISLTENKLYITDTLIGNRVYVDLNKANLKEGTPVKTISIMDKNLVGDVTSRLK
ncbi:linear amide C-N hydrolase [Allofrancisella guangzhouensis]|uniref:Choloylglycine hydrolase n=1 Tax=Allofrancisella guangzhouensis TaxID=594679 RepID=A0A0A8E3N0_9GAMM|nr:linear amide C-N hydrolase [Allofrancisella guangzhouensis]AJC48840.1 choloylglycine hydrolase [Allofrancisella guangzhouensis]MBK2027259.1 linear amide C-N hydrolase [Allofrancisella guangzhouensis]MBK2044713.1 linear amide C-N hydrolase [Allofrancisella guangzhouensis]MBK2045945.1 linear amide C-N hydrolase [Allofrancisella guangzhouensis]